MRVEYKIFRESILLELRIGIAAKIQSNEQSLLMD